ncbi:hypothetical protein B0H14DRAFT_3761737 [Mycena olivaceomarginata]|nr:hypothetical protein B0H14DRAFT_3761737 [Mycena olivaceomarginata]
MEPSSLQCVLRNPPSQAIHPILFLNLDTLTFVIIPGDPDSDSYNAHSIPDERTSMVYGLGRVTDSPQTLDGHSSRVVTVTVSDYVRDETRASTLQVPIPHTNSGMQFYSICRDFTPAGVFRVKLLSVATDPVVPTTVSTEVHPPSNMPAPSALDVPSGPMFYSHPFQHYPQQASTVSGPFMAPFLPPLPYSLAGHPMFSQPGFSSNASFNSHGKYLSPTAIDSHVLNSPADPGSSSAPGPSNDEESAFNKSAADPYKYPMTQIRPTSQSVSKPTTTGKTTNKQSSSTPSKETTSGLQSSSQESTSGPTMSGAPRHNLNLRSRK